VLSRLRRLHPVRLARPMARRPGLFALLAALLCALAATGFARFAVDAGPDLLVGQSSDTKQVYDRFSKTFGSDPIVIVMNTAMGSDPGNPTAYYLERNLLRLGALESDITRDPRVASVLGPGTIAGSAQAAAAGEVSRVRDEYPYFVAETALASAIQQGEKDPTKLGSVESNAFQAAQVAMAADIVKAAQDADLARAAYNKDIAQHQSDQVLRGRELAAEKAASNTQPPPLFAQYIAGPTGTADPAGAQALFDRLSAGFGDCSDEIAAVLHIDATCQVFLERLFLDLPNCPKATTHQFCTPKEQWAAVLPKPRTNGPSLAVITVRLKPEVIGHADQVNDLVAKIRDELVHGSPKSSNTVTRSLGGFVPTQCGTPDTSGGPPTACEQRFHDAPLQFTIAGAPLLVQGVAGTMTHLLLALFPIAFLVMLLLLLGVFRVRGRIWPLVAAGGAALLTIGGGLLLGVSVSPAVLAGVPVLVGLGVDYAVQLVARFSEERGRGLGLEAALRVTLGSSGPATMIAGVATLAGLVALAVLTGIDLGPLTAVPLVAEFALVLCAGVVFSWLAAALIALPAAAWGEKRRELRDGPPVATAAAAADAADITAPRTAALAERWRLLLVPAAMLAVLGWALMPRLPIETGVDKLLAPSLTELRDIQDVRDQIGYDNEIDFAVEGNIPGSDPRAAVPDTVVWMAQAGADARCLHPGDVALAITIGDVFAASADQSGATTSCQAPGSSPSPSPTPSPSASPSPAVSPSGAASPSPSVSPSPSARRYDGDIVRVGQVVAQATTPAPSPAASTTPGPTAPSTPVPTPAITNPAASGTLQSAFLCSVRLLPVLARNLIGPIPVSTQPCPARDLYRNVFLGVDPTPISPREARIAMGVRLTSVADQARLIDQVHRELGTPPKGLTVTPTGLTALAAQGYDTLTSRILLFNLVPLAVVALVLLGIFRDLRRALLPVLPAALAAGWSSLVIEVLGRIPGASGTAVGSLNPLTVVLGALIIALATEFGVVLLQRFYEERSRGLDPEAAAGAALHGVGRAVLVSASTLGAGFVVLALSGLAPGGLPLIADFGLAVVIDLALAVGAVFLVMLPLAVAWERSAPLELAPPISAGGGFESRQPQTRRPYGPSPVGGRRARPGRAAAERQAARAAAAAAVVEEEAEPEVAMDEAPPEFPAWSPEDDIEDAEPEAPASPPPPAAPAAAAAPPSPSPAKRFPGVSGRRHPAAPPAAAPPAPAPTGTRPPARLPGVSGRRRPAGSIEPPAASAPPPTATEPAARRMPGGVTRRRPSGAAPAPEAPPLAAPEPPAPAPETAPHAPEIAAHPPQQPRDLRTQPPGGSRSRRRRPPPWVRRQDGGEGGPPPTRPQ
jgi:predicted RND superfamily exporter protein